MRARLALGVLLASAGPAWGADLIVDGTTITLGGYHAYERVEVIHGGVIEVVAFDGVDKLNTGNLELVAETLLVDDTSLIDARGAGYQPTRCADGPGPTATAGGRGGCAVRDSGGGGAHFGVGGRGTKDCDVAQCGIGANSTCEFPQEFEEDCGNTLNGAGTACSGSSDCRSCDALPSVAGLPFRHSIYEAEFGAAGGDKGCRDGDGFGDQPLVAGAGGGRIVLVGLDAAATGQVQIDGRVLADGGRGCGTGNDSAGGGAGGTVLIVGDTVQVGPSAIVSAVGGLGGDTQGLAGSPDCPPPAQQGGVCDDCGGGGGGGIIHVQSRTSELQYTAQFNVDGGLGGTCTLCQGEAGGGAGELQLDGAFVGEVCDGYDNDFDLAIDEDLPLLPCGLPSCAAGLPQVCPPEPGCAGPVTDTRARFAVIMDTSGSMLTDLEGRPTFGDGSVGHEGVDIDGDGIEGNDSKLFIAKSALTDVISAYPEIDLALGRYHQDVGLGRACQLAHWFECHDICCSYDDPRDNVPPPATPACTLDGGGSGDLVVNTLSTAGDECLNYAGSCGPPERGADFVAGFGSPVNQYLMWLDGTEMLFDDDTTEGDFCSFASGGDCEFRGTGPTPLAGSLEAAAAYLAPIVACDAAAPCRRYAVVLLTDGAESCLGDPVAAAASLFDDGIETFVVGFSVLPEEETELDAIAAAGSGGLRGAFFAGDQSELVNALAVIVADAVISERCNDADDDCDGLIDEDFPEKGTPCDDGGIGACKGTGAYVCNLAEDGTECVITMPPGAADDEVCNGVDDDCDGLVDEGLSCVTPCVPSGAEVCDGVDNDCDLVIDEEDPELGQPCGVTDVPPCLLGEKLCIGGVITCVGALDPQPEICNGIDDDCDGDPDALAPCPGESSCLAGGCRNACSDVELDCPPGFLCADDEGGRFCVPDACADCAPGEICVDGACFDPCEGVECAEGLSCYVGGCYDCHILGCPDAQVCYAGTCQASPCADVTCPSPLDSCVDGTCVPACDDELCAGGETCGGDGECHEDPCVDVRCRELEVCLGGVCVHDRCAGVTCPIGDVCVLGDCMDDPCPVVECASGRECVVGADGEPRCEATVKPITVLAGGGGGCACEVGGRRGPEGGVLLGALALLGLLLARRRRCAWLALVALAGTGCVLDGYTFRSAPDAAVDAAVADDGAPLPDSSPPCIPIGVDDQCDEIDNDCNGVRDDEFDKLTDGDHCGVCGRRCVAEGAILACEAGECVFQECQLGHADLEPGVEGCEYRCPVFPPESEECNGVDDDCDGEPDEAADLPPAPLGQCRQILGTPCAGVGMVCDTRGGVSAWFCDYPAAVEFDPSVVNGIFLEETLCDGEDGDCDGLADDPFVDVGQECDNGMIGGCRDLGYRVCDPGDPSSTICDLGLPPDAAVDEPTAEVCNAIDDDCDGTVDEDVVDDMVEIDRAGLHFWMYRYEASRPDATDASSGTLTSRACSTGGVRPWTLASFANAEEACAAAGKRLCTGEEFATACGGAAGTAYPYGDAYDPDACNGVDYDGVAGGMDDDVLVPTGLPACVGEDGIYDLSGNAKEWTDDVRGDTGPPDDVPIVAVRGGAFDTPAAGLACEFDLSRAAVTFRSSALGFRCCSDSAP